MPDARFRPSQRMNGPPNVPRAGWLLRLGVFVCAVYVFLAAIELFGGAIKLLGEDTAERLFAGLQNPFAGLAVGVLSTVLVQSSSVTTSSIVAMVGSGTLPLACAVPMVMGANVGTSITNTLVSLGHVTQDSAFRRAFAGATVHDLFNLLSVAILLPIELATGFLQHAAERLVGFLPLEAGGGTFHSPVRSAVKWLAGEIQSLFGEACGLADIHFSGLPDQIVLASVLVVAALAMIIASLILITRNMKALMADRIEQWLNSVLRRSGLLGLVIGALVTMSVQSSSITTSLLVPMFGAGILSLEAAFPIMLGANIGTTITAMLAASVTGPTGLTIAVVHLLFNLCGTLIFFPLKPVRRIPIRLAEGLASLATRNRVWVVVYIFSTFVLLPVLGILIWKS
jgi:sodium-dependent phosphate cotransporter